ncbi:hypothetical protein SCHPADRAFT_288401 [Schizopora paradoxa]|uniref:MYND-type domain-containing protein n=1 Tax=Schizopora paradoxa TaxID=27342 RepID=A0A0H2RZT9_9AGAM|nr:hypothetical protein SCHPADRAFT_288401 [Schizopora paradoxa]
MHVYLPLQRFERCFKCEKKEELRLCSRCGEATYCSQACQKSDWDVHKLNCGKTDIIDLSKFYPILACLAESSHVFKEKPVHPALLHKVINDANPGVLPCELPDGLSPAKLLILGGERQLEARPNDKTWMPLAKTLKIEGKLIRRVVREGYALPIAMAICVALVRAIYTTTYSKDGGKRVRLRYGSSPIADFGICTGSAIVKSQDRLAYWLPSGEILPGQDPSQHYWIYFTTTRGEEITVDLAMFTFNVCTVVPTFGYGPLEMSAPTPFAPVFFRDREIRKNSPELYNERGRLSILRNATVLSMFDDPKCVSEGGFYSEFALNKLVSVAEQFAGHSFSDAEVEMLKLSAVRHSSLLSKEIQTENWKRYPKEVMLAIEQDPGQCDNLEKKGTAWAKTMQKWKRAYRKTNASTKQ